ncbi:transcriptional regulator, HxlR family [Streptomyces sp. TLI_053]|uniref:winged helix-turn-helix transcriptional regulator n=1 Tax=Streptomyces sp. TLI_053 TaxID=1855352 RepID=UPI00087CD584|nr:helix-turn-helix domain-containing protein [Streptomyces sp. TLI_053]SDT83129.1 transcriptional regulator, HxlR family [Streptomyces sp. TLI_053]
MTPHTDARTPADRPATTALPGRPCSIAAALQVLGEKWALLAVRELFYGNHRFDRIARNTGAPRDRLTARLRALEEAGVVERRAYSERPPRYEYHLTEAGRDLAPLTQALLAWGDRWLSPEPPVVLHHHPGRSEHTGHPEHRHDPGGPDDAHDAHGPDDPDDPHDPDSPGHPLDAAWTCRTCGVEVRSPDVSLEVRSPGWDHRGPTVPGSAAASAP